MRQPSGLPDMSGGSKAVLGLPRTWPGRTGVCVSETKASIRFAGYRLVKPAWRNPWFEPAVRDIRMLRIEENTDLMPVFRQASAASRSTAKN